MRLDPLAGAPAHVSMVDGFDDASIDIAVWGTKVENGGTAITESGGFLTIANAAGAAGISYLPTLHNYGDYIVCQVEITVVDGEAAGDGERCEASLVWYKDAENYIKWGVYRDTGEALNSSGFIRYNIDGAGESFADITGVNVDNDSHTFKIIKHASQVEIYYDGVYQTGLAFPEIINYNVRLEAGTQNAGDTIDIDFDNFKMFNHTDPFGTDITSVNTDLETIAALLNGSNITAGSGTLSIPLNGVEYAIEFTTAIFGSVFEVTFIADLDAANGFDTNAKANCVLDVGIFKEFGGAYPSLPQDTYAWQKDVTLDRNVDVDHIRCAENTKITFEVDLIPDDTISVPYRYIVRRLKT